jgi:propanol-preferring alcohol dehydrogenase
MKAVVLEKQGGPLKVVNRPCPQPGPGELLVRVGACAVCRTDLHIYDGDLTSPKLPLILGHEIVGRVEATGSGVSGVHAGDRVGIPWLGGTCGVCSFCRAGKENLCDRPRFTGYDRDGGFARFAVADARFVFPIPAAYDDISAAPLLCAGLIGYRALRMAGDARRLGLYGFGAAAHIITQVALRESREVFAFTRPGDTAGQAFARSLGAVWAEGSDQSPPEPLDAAIIFAPVGSLVPRALRETTKGGVVICAGIHMSEIPAFPYEHLWGERVLRSVANLNRRDGEEFFALAPTIPVRTQVETFPLESAGEALARLRAGHVRGAAVLVPDGDRV